MSTELNLQDIEISVETITERFGGGEDVKELEKEANALKDRMNLGYNPTRDFSAERKRVYERVIDLLSNPLPIALRTGGSASSPIPAAAPAATITL